MSQTKYEEFELSIVCSECPDEAADAVTALRKEIRTLSDLLTKEREANKQTINHIESRIADQRRWGNAEIVLELSAVLDFIKEGNEPNEGSGKAGSEPSV